MKDESRSAEPCSCGDLTLDHCQEAMERLEDYLHRELTTQDRAELEGHLKLCDHCTEEYGLRSAAQDVLRCKLLGEHCPEALRAAISARIRASA